MSTRLLRVDLGPGVLAGFTTREGGTSTGHWLGLNLGDHVGDDPLAVAGNRRALAELVGAPVRFLHQVHGTRVLVLAPAVPEEEDVLPGEGTGPVGRAGTPEPSGHDAIVLSGTGTAGAVMVADCVPVLLADPEAGVVAAAHAGRLGLLAGVLRTTVERMTALGADPGRVRAAVGPCAGPCCYEVPEELRGHAAGILPDTWARTRAGTPALDLRAGCRQALRQLGVGRVEDVDRCTVEDDLLYSYRRSATTGRFAGVVRLLP